jgi:hypothetical protein
LRFPLIEGQSSAAASAEIVYCYCLSTDGTSKPMVECSGCLRWFHYDCLNDDDAAPHQRKKWWCRVCSKNLLKSKGRKVVGK